MCEQIQDKPLAQIRKRILKHENRSDDCEIMLVFKEKSKFITHSKFTKAYNCLGVKTYKVGGYHFQSSNDYECMSHAMLKNPECKGFLFLSEDDKPFDVEKVLRDDRNRIWYKKRTNSKRFEVSFTNKKLFRSNRNSFCKKAFEELALLNQIWLNNLKKIVNASSHSSWNVGMTLNALLWNGKGKFVCFYEHLGSFYVPVKHRINFLSVASVFSKIKMPNDLAIATILKSLDLESTFIHIPT